MNPPADLDSLFFPTLYTICSELQCDPLHLIKVSYSESNVMATAWNDNPKTLPPEKRWNASGLIQFMPPTLVGLGWSKGHAAFRQLSATQQLEYVRRYFAPHRGKLVSVGAIYTATFLPALLSHAGNPDFVLTAKDGPLGWAYAPNAAFDANKDYAITVRELEQAVERNCQGRRWYQIMERMGQTPAEVVDNGFDLGTTLGVQRALQRLGFDPGKLDGLPGPKTSKAVLEFQIDRSVFPHDGIYGPKTRAALDIALRTAQ